MANCRICETPYRPFHSFGRMPIANGFTSPGAEDPYRFELAVGFCTSCAMVQLIEQPDPRMMFHENYAFFSSTSRRMAEHFAAFADWARATYARSADPFVVEVGSNDGIMLQHFARAGVRHMGIEPSANVAAAARAKGVRTVSEFFDSRLAARLKVEEGPADLILAANVMCHIPDLHSVAAGVADLLAPAGVFIFEDPYLPEILTRTSYDQIYDEHVFYFSLTSLAHLFRGHGLEIVDAVPQEVHGGSMRYVVAQAGAHKIHARVREGLAREEVLGVMDPRTYEAFAERVRTSRRRLMATLQELRAQGKRIVGYGATSKSTTVINYCGIGPGHLEFISDTTPGKQGKQSPGAGIPIRPHETFAAAAPDYALLFAWNHAAEIMEKEQAFTARGGRWIVYVPDVKVVP